jgi:hypothetical protein
VKASSCGPSLIFWAYALEFTTLRSREALSLRPYLFSLPFLGLGYPGLISFEIFKNRHGNLKVKSAAVSKLTVSY